MSVSTWLPPGNWVDWSGQTEHAASATAGVDVLAQFTVKELPMYVRSGSVVVQKRLS